MTIRYGITFPHDDEWAKTGTSAIRQYVLAAERARFDYLTAADHVLGADSTSRPSWNGPYDATNPFREVFVLFGFLAGFTTLELMTAVLVLPQRQTAVVAKQAAEIDQLHEGRLRLGVGVGWNEVEYTGLEVDFHTRGARYEEQLEVLRLLWTLDLVSFKGRFHELDRVGILPSPIQRPIPLWLGGGGGGRATIVSEERLRRVLERIGRLGDGWIAGHRTPPEQLKSAFAIIRRAADEAGRDPDAVGLQGSLHVHANSTRGELVEGIEARRTVGVTHLTMEIRKSGNELSLGQSIDLLGLIGDAIAVCR